MTDSTDDAPNEIIAAAREQQAVRDAAAAARRRAGKVALGVGIGSTAIVAALLFASHNRKDPE